MAMLTQFLSKNVSFQNPLLAEFGSECAPSASITWMSGFGAGFPVIASRFPLSLVQTWSAKSRPLDPESFRHWWEDSPHCSQQ